MDRILVLDVGSTNLKVLAYDSSGKCLFSLHTPFPSLDSPLAAEEVWCRAERLLKEALERLSSPPWGLALTSQRGSGLLWDPHTSQVKSLLFSWRSAFLERHAQRLNRRFGTVFWRRLAERVFPCLPKGPLQEQVKLISRFSFLPSMASVALSYYRQQGAEPSWKFGTLDSWLLWNLTRGKVHATDISHASATGLFDPLQGEWSALLLKILQIPLAWLPTVRSSNGPFGIAHIGSHRIPIRAVLADQQASLWALSHWGRHLERLGVSIGTGLFFHLGLDGFHAPVSKSLLPMVWIDAEQRRYMLEGMSGSGASVFQWLIEQGFCQSHWQRREHTAPLSPEVDAFFWPPFPPHFVEKAPSPGWFFRRPVSYGELLRAVLNFYGFCAHKVQQAFAEEQLTFSEVWLDGGGAKDDHLCQTLAEAFRLPVVRPKWLEATSYGVAGVAFPLPPLLEEERFVPQLTAREREKWLGELTCWWQTLAR